MKTCDRIQFRVAKLCGPIAKINDAEGQGRSGSDNTGNRLDPSASQDEMAEEAAAGGWSTIESDEVS